MRTFEFIIDPAYRLHPVQKENVSVQVRVFRKSVTQPNKPTALTRCTQAEVLAHPHTFHETAYYNANTVDPDMDVDGACEFDDCCGADDPAAHYAALGLTIMDEREFRRAYCNGFAALV